MIEKIIKYTINSTSFEKKLAKEYMEFEKNNTKRLCDLKVQKEISFKKTKRYFFWINVLLIFMLFYFYKDGASLLLLSFLLFIIISNISYIRYRKRNVSSVEKVWTLSGFENVIKEEFLESYANKELLEEYKKEIGEERFRDFIFENGSDNQKIKVKLLVL